MPADTKGPRKLARQTAAIGQPARGAGHDATVFAPGGEQAAGKTKASIP